MEYNKQLLEQYKGKTSIATQLSSGNKVRFMVEYDEKTNDISSVFVFQKNKKHYGYRFSPWAFLEYYSPAPLTDKNAEWKRRLKRAIKLMDESGLWSNVKEIYQNLYDFVSLEEKQKIYNDNSSYVRDEEGKIKSLENLADIKARFPFMIKQNENGEDYLNTDYIYELSDCKLKSMYFGKYGNNHFKQEIKKALGEKKNYSIPYLKLNYDVSFEYNAEKNMAWYSEEYRNCGNGHYYLALNHSTALFGEDD